MEVQRVQKQVKQIMEMMKLSRKLRRSHGDDAGEDKYSLPTRDDSQPIDTQQQEELVRSYERRHAQQSHLWRRVFSLLLLCFVFFLMYSSFQQASSPWGLRYHAYFMDEVEPGNVVYAELLAVLGCLMAARGLVYHDARYRRQWMWYSAYMGFLLAIFWLNYMLRMPKFRWDVIWLPLGPLTGAGVCLYVDRLLAESYQEIQKLRGYMYSFKAS